MKLTFVAPSKWRIPRAHEVTGGPSGLAADEVQVWSAEVDQFTNQQVDEFARLLDTIEMAQASRFKLQADRAAYVVAHSLRRMALSRVLAFPAGELMFTHVANRKPLLVAPTDTGIHFGHSHTRGLVACALTRVAPVGIDVECHHGGEADFALLKAFMPMPGDQQRTLEIDADPARQFFFYWTALEAFWKAHGNGISSGNPRLNCVRSAQGTFEIFAEDCASHSLARVVQLNFGVPWTASVALLNRPHPIRCAVDAP